MNDNFNSDLRKYILPLSILLQKSQITEIYTRIIGYELLHCETMKIISDIPHLYYTFINYIKKEFIDGVVNLDKIINAMFRLDKKQTKRANSPHYLSLMKLHNTLIDMKQFLVPFYKNKNNPDFKQILIRENTSNILNYIIHFTFKNVSDIMWILRDLENTKSLYKNIDTKFKIIILTWTSKSIEIKNLNIIKMKNFFDMTFDEKYTVYDMKKKLFE
ncbi:hypothetical protein SLOPH_956 [Spraguea lophii 42_110]|uniref:Uncharacterized protein n=1 Tax=Spraguea lophii (strain 42_110) TaxID=1358809 RepID=S7XIT5_SPRLO|nr:hypothetical protein SLOPH_956 [Spraguea lophii 42_110]